MIFPRLSKLTKEQIEKAHKEQRRKIDIEKSEYQKQNPGAEFITATANAVLISITRALNVGTSMLIDTFGGKDSLVCRKKGNGWEVGKIRNPMFIKTKSDEAFQYLIELIRLNPKYEYSSGIKTISALKLDLIVKPHEYPNDTYINEDDDMLSGEDIDIKKIDSIKDIMPTEKELSGKSDSERGKIRRDAVERIRAMKEVEGEVNDDLDLLHEDDDELDPGASITQDGLTERAMDSIDNPMLSKTEKEQHKKALKELEEKKAIACETRDMDAVADIEENIMIIKGRLGRGRIDPKDDKSQVNKARGRIRKGIGRAIKAIREQSNRKKEGAALADFLHERIDTEDPFSYNPRKDDPSWIDLA